MSENTTARSAAQQLRARARSYWRDSNSDALTDDQRFWMRWTASELRAVANQVEGEGTP
ncbi:MAG: hypothetical protein ACRDQA_06730 [Nocardioidaceae bacterium]